MSEPLAEFLDRMGRDGRVVPFELVQRHRRERHVAASPVAASPVAASPVAAPLAVAVPALPPAPPVVEPAPRVLPPGTAADPRILYGSFANSAPPAGSVLRYLDAANFGWAPASAGVVVVVAPASGAVVTMAGDLLYVNNGAELSSLTIRLPAGPVPGQMAGIGFAHPVTVLSVTDAAGSAVAGAPADVYGPGNALYFRYIDGVIAWVFWK